MQTKCSSYPCDWTVKTSIPATRYRAALSLSHDLHINKCTTLFLTMVAKNVKLEENSG